MLRVTPINTDRFSILKLEGRLAGPWVDEVRRCWKEVSGQSRDVQVDLKEVSFVDHLGRELLLGMQRDGVSLVGYSEFIRHLLLQGGPARQHKSVTEEHHGGPIQS